MLALAGMPLIRGIITRAIVPAHSRVPRSSQETGISGTASHIVRTYSDKDYVALQSTLSFEPPPLSKTPEPQDPAASQPSRPLPPLPPTTPKALSVSAAAPAPAASEATSVPQLVTGEDYRMNLHPQRHSMWEASLLVHHRQTPVSLHTDWCLFRSMLD